MSYYERLTKFLYVQVSFVTNVECNAKALLKDEYIVLIEHYIW